MGWVQRQHVKGGVAFIDLRDRDGITQITFDKADGEEALRDYRSVAATVDRVLPDYFSVFPAAGFEIRPVEAFRAESAASASPWAELTGMAKMPPTNSHIWLLIHIFISGYQHHGWQSGCMPEPRGNLR